VAHVGGKTVFVAGTAPGETARCRLIAEHRSWARAEALEILASSPDRDEPVCPLYGICGGCNFQHLRYEAQLAAKRAILWDAFARIGGLVVPEPALVPSSPWEYRNRMQFHRSGGALALKARGSGDLVSVSDCPVADPGIRAALRGGSLSPARERFTVYSRGGLLLSEGGTRRGRTRLIDRDISLDAGVFFQSNGALLERLIADLMEIAGGVADRSLPLADIYCGVGVFAAFLGDLFPAVELVEENRTALALARENVRHSRADFFALRDSGWARMKARAGASPGCIVLDPPRQGLSPALAGWLAEAGPPLLAYVSCDPATLARDSAILSGGGYTVTELRLYDFYPQTAHIESLAVLCRPR
jgi:23S rRNA (uracil1939-C5)-methyltransferase